DKAASCCVDIKFSSSVKAFVEVDREVFISSVANILNNSIEACIEKGCKGEISIDIRPGKLLPEGKYVEIVIRDNGAGVSGDDLAKVMDPLFTTKNKGTGIGLSVAKSA
ncbi:MAG: hypothetical protein GWO08_22950, partial [Gammaproteobacteria bacterium]|nr:hypothetical protein [Gammaproteobacteria bacterium]NIQ76050.1 hypothetical protein [Gammaproteobacteria bacterium]NIR96386.1 hypothetical protein [Gammaproteobacteria bacterium]NIW39616.1 hypothetical protein [candidate division Zixibacteria bacterium]NIX57527.1 hypothetical protein [candidate division Zixibacteria bacterium]